MQYASSFCHLTHLQRGLWIVTSTNHNQCDTEQTSHAPKLPNGNYTRIPLCKSNRLATTLQNAPLKNPCPNSASTASIQENYQRNHDNYITHLLKDSYNSNFRQYALKPMPPGISHVTHNISWVKEIQSTSTSALPPIHENCNKRQTPWECTKWPPSTHAARPLEVLSAHPRTIAEMCDRYRSMLRVRLFK